jgi:hypothetical protein
MDKVQKYNSFNTNTPSSESYRNYLVLCVKENKTAGHVARMGKIRSACTLLVGKPEGKRSICRWKDNIKMNLKKEVRHQGAVAHM